MTEHHGALIVGPGPIAHPSGAGLLTDTTFVVKDLFDVAGQRTGAGNPEVLEAAHPARVHAAAVERLLAAGATCVGKSHTVETAYALSGVNDHYGTPVNPVDPARDPGGSSSGSAVAVAGGLVDFALGSDTAGSVRVPASYCGIVGVRPTHGRVPLDGVFPLAPRFDTVGWFARTGELARTVGRALLDTPGRRPGLGRLVVATDLFGQCDPGHGETIDGVVAGIGRVLGAEVEPVRFWGEGERGEWPAVFRTLQRFDAWRTNRHWIETLQPRFGPRVAPRWEEAAAVTPEENEAAERLAALLSERAWELLGGDTVLVVPSAPGPAPLLDADPGEVAATRRRLMALTTIAPVAGLPEVSLPLMGFDGLPVGIGLMAGPGNDELLLDLAAALV
ncbi:MAG: amidase [Acidimicrobiales bacterium]|nr:amidase [Acidimicrobiales bacterium]